MNIPDDVQDAWCAIEASDDLAGNLLDVEVVRSWLALAAVTLEAGPRANSESVAKIPLEVAAEWAALRGTDNPDLNLHSIAVIGQWITRSGLEAGWLVPCALCGNPVEPGSCCDCGYATCPYCRDGRGSGAWGGGQACPHWVGVWGDDEAGVIEGRLAGIERPGVWLTREPTEAEILTAFGDMAPIGLRVWEWGFSDQPGDLRTVYDIACDEQGGAAVAGMASDSSSITDWFVTDPDSFEARVQEIVAQLEAGIDKLPQVMGDQAV